VATTATWLLALWLGSSARTLQAAVWVSHGPEGRSVQTLAIDPTGTLYAGTDGGVFKSTTGGRSGVP
jgi:hypothetical protein